MESCLSIPFINSSWWILLNYIPIFFRDDSLAQSYDCPRSSGITLKRLSCLSYVLLALKSSYSITQPQWVITFLYIIWPLKGHVRHISIAKYHLISTNRMLVVRMVVMVASGWYVACSKPDTHCALGHMKYAIKWGKWGWIMIWLNHSSSVKPSNNYPYIYITWPVSVKKHLMDTLISIEYVHNYHQY